MKYLQRNLTPDVQDALSPDQQQQALADAENTEIDLLAVGEVGHARELRVAADLFRARELDEAGSTPRESRPAAPRTRGGRSNSMRDEQA